MLAGIQSEENACLLVLTSASVLHEYANLGIVSNPLNHVEHKILKACSLSNLPMDAGRTA